MRKKLVISKKWHKPEFLYKITDEDMSAEVYLDDFVKALSFELKPLILSSLKSEIGSVTWTFKQDTFDKQMDEAIENTFDKRMLEAVQKVISGIKYESVKVI